MFGWLSVWLMVPWLMWLILLRNQVEVEEEAVQKCTWSSEGDMVLSEAAVAVM